MRYHAYNMFKYIDINEYKCKICYKHFKGYERVPHARYELKQEQIKNGGN